MVTTFNKRELLEFANWNILQERFPKHFVVKYNENNHHKIFFDMMELREDLTPETKESYMRRYESGEAIYYYPSPCLGDRDRCSFITLPESSMGGIHTNNAIELNHEKFNRCLFYENIPLFTTDDVDMWLKFQKGVVFHKRMISS